MRYRTWTYCAWNAGVTALKPHGAHAQNVHLRQVRVNIMVCANAINCRFGRNEIVSDAIVGNMLKLIAHRF